VAYDIYEPGEWLEGEDEEEEVDEEEEGGMLPSWSIPRTRLCQFICSSDCIKRHSLVPDG
jgi:hypothetical protein